MRIMYLNILILDISKYSNPNREKGSPFQIQMKDYFTKMTFVGFVSSVNVSNGKREINSRSYITSEYSQSFW